MIRLALAAVLVAGPALAAGTSSDTPPSPTQTSECPQGTVYSAERGGCVAPDQSGLSDDDLFQAVRELAYAGRYDDATLTLDAMDEGATTRVETYRGFIARRTGDAETAMDHYERALEIDPDNLLARSYMGQGKVTEGDVAGAEFQLAEIVARGGAGTWPELSLRLAIQNGETFAY